MNLDKVTAPFEWPDNTALTLALREGEELNDAEYLPLFKALLEATLVVPLHEPPVTSPQGVQSLKPFLVEMEGQPAVIAYSDEEALTASFPELSITIIGLPMSSVCALAHGAGTGYLILNPHGPTSFLVGPDQMRALDQGRMPVSENPDAGREENPGGLELKVERLAQPLPDGLKEELAQLAAAQGLTEVWACNVTYRGTGAHPALAVEPMSQGIANAIGPKIEMAWQNHLPAEPGQTLFDLFALEAAPRDFRARGQLIYSGAA